MPTSSAACFVISCIYRVLRLRDGHIVEDELNESPVAAAELDW